MKITKEQLKKINEINEAVKELDPILKERIIDYELYELFKDDYLKIAPFIKKEETQKALNNEIHDVKEPPPVGMSKKTPSLRKYFLEKQPLTATEIVAVFGFYLEHFKNKTEFGEKDISDAYFEARARKPKALGQSLRDAKNVKGYLVEGGKKGKYRLSNEGENLVMHDLPRKFKTKP